MKRWQTDKAKAQNAQWKKTKRGRALQNKHRKVWQAELRKILTRLKSVPCADCGGVFDPVCMDFDHRTPGTKRESVARLCRHGIKVVLAEVEKCDVVCANCHRIRTYRKRDHEEWRGAVVTARTAAESAATQLKLELPRAVVTAPDGAAT